MKKILGLASANTLLNLVEDTDYFIHYEDVNDFIVSLADNSALSGVALLSHKD